MVIRDQKQLLVDVLFEIAIMSKENDRVQAMNEEEHTQWIRDQLGLCGFIVEPMGSSHGVLFHSGR